MTVSTLEASVTPTPTGRARTFGRDELIVSKTDPQGRITYANDVFCRISGYTCEEIVGRPHSIIRHPLMPRGVFRLLWDTVASGREVFAYINNLAKNGDHYWVLAHVTPTLDRGGRITGFHSNRRLPSASAVRTVEDLYRRMSAAESGHTNSRAAAEAGFDVLQNELRDAGLGYDEFVWSVIETNRTAA